MPKTVELTNYISKINASKISGIISKLKAIKFNNFEYGEVYKLTGQLPLFKFDYTFNLISDLKKLSIKDVFDKKKLIYLIYQKRKFLILIQLFIRRI